MDTQIQEFVSLECLSATLRLPRRYLRALAFAGEIPALRVSGRLRFHIGTVKAALLRKAEHDVQEETKVTEAERSHHAPSPA